MSDTKPTVDLAAELARLRRDYLLRLPAELVTLAQLTDQLANASPTLIEDICHQLHPRLHKLAGSGGTFGLNRLGSEARLLEQLVKSPGSPDGLRQRLHQGLQVMQADLAEQLQQQTPQPTALLPHQTIQSDDSPLLWLAEDDAALGQELEAVLRQFGYRARWFSRIQELIAALRALPTPSAPEQLAAWPHALIMDVLFPAEGCTAFAALREADLSPLPCPLLFITADNNFSTRVEAAQLGANAFLLKPLDASQLVDRLEAVFEQQRAAPYRVLVVDDDQPLANHFALVLRTAGMEVEVLEDPRSILDRVADFRPELVLMDMHMPDYTGPELAAVIRQHDEWLGLPIVYLSAETDLDQQIQALGRGADDFLTKPISDPQLIAAVRVRVTRSRQLADLMSKDSLTGLLKHSRIKEEIDIAMARGRRHGKPVSVVMVDIDHFKSVNDRFGHPVGDRVIKAVAHLLRQRLRKTDVIGRYGGEEFAVILPECDATTGKRLLDDIRERFATLHFQQPSQQTGDFSCTLSAGLACSTDFPMANGAQLLVRADEALYSAKHGGRNQVCLATTTS